MEDDASIVVTAWKYPGVPKFHAREPEFRRSQVVSRKENKIDSTSQPGCRGSQTRAPLLTSGVLTVTLQLATVEQKWSVVEDRKLHGS